MSLQNLQQLSAEDQRKVKEFTDTGMRMLQEIADYKDSLKDKAKDLAEHLDIKPSHLMKHLTTQFKTKLEQEKEDLEIIETLAQISGRA